MTKKSIRMDIKEPGEWPKLMAWVSHNVSGGLRKGAVSVVLTRPGRSSDQNARLWPSLQDIASQIDWPRGSGIKRSKEDWKQIFMSAYRYEVGKIIQGLNGEVVNIGLSSSTLTVSEFSELIEFIHATGAEFGVRWSDPALKSYEKYGFDGQEFERLAGRPCVTSNQQQ